MGYIVFSIISILILTLYEKITVRYIYLGGLKIILNFSVLEITLWNFKKRKKKPLSKRLRGFSAYKNALGYIISHSKINIDRIFLNRSSTSVSKNAIASFGAYPALLSLAIALFSELGGEITESDNDAGLAASENLPEQSYFNITLTVRVIHFFTGLLNFALGYFKKTKRGFTNGR